MQEQTKTNLKYLLLQSFLCCANGCYFGFLVIYLTDHGHNAMTVGTIMTVLSVAGLAITPMLGYLSDFVIPVKRLIGACLLAAIPAAFLLKISVKIVPLALLSILSMSLFERHLMPVVDSWGVKVMEKKPYLNYGVARGTAAFLYAVSGLLLGRLFDAKGIDMLFYAHAVLAGGGFFVVMFFDAVPVAQKTSERKVSLLHAAKRLLQNPRYRLLLVCLTLAGVCSVSAVTFQPLRLSEMGGDTAAMGASMFVMAFSEMPAMFAARHLLRRFRASSLLAVAFFGVVLRMLANALAPTLSLLIALQCLQSLSYGLLLPVLLAYLQEITERELTATAITLGIACFEGVFGVLGNLIGGALAAAFGARIVLLGFAGISLMAFLLFFFGIMKEKQTQHGTS